MGDSKNPILPTEREQVKSKIAIISVDFFFQMEIKPIILAINVAVVPTIKINRRQEKLLIVPHFRV